MAIDDFVLVAFCEGFFESSSLLVLVLVLVVIGVSLISLCMLPLRSLQADDDPFLTASSTSYGIDIDADPAPLCPLDLADGVRLGMPRAHAAVCLQSRQKGLL